MVSIEQINVSLVEDITGRILGVTSTESSLRLLQPATPTETEYIVGIEGVATGFAILGSLNPETGFQLKSVPPEAFRVTPAAPRQKAVSEPAFGTASFLTLMVVVADAVQFLPQCVLSI
jgi:hypothetical protein